MDLPFPVQEVNEGAARLQVPEVPRRKGPGTAGPWPFYNPTMRVNRDLSAVVLAKWPRPLRSALDGLAACGAWGIRMRLETRLDRVAFNDRSDIAARLIRENLRRNRIDGEVTSLDFVSHIQSGPVSVSPRPTPRSSEEPIPRRVSGGTVLARSDALRDLRLASGFSSDIAPLAPRTRATRFGQSYRSRRNTSSGSSGSSNAGRGPPCPS